MMPLKELITLSGLAEVINLSVLYNQKLSPSLKSFCRDQFLIIDNAWSTIQMLLLMFSIGHQYFISISEKNIYMYFLLITL